MMYSISIIIFETEAKYRFIPIRFIIYLTILSSKKAVRNTDDGSEDERYINVFSRLHEEL